jgi:urease accessory protein
MRLFSALAKKWPKIGRSFAARVGKAGEFVSPGGPAFASVAVPDFERDRDRYAGMDLPAARLEPEVMRGSALRQGQQCYQTECKTLHRNTFRDHSEVLARITLLVAMLFSASPAVAHSETGLAGGFVAGLSHPLAGPDHMLAMISVGLWGHFLKRPMIYLLPMVFPMMMAVGAGVGMFGLALPAVETGIALSVIILGALILFAVRAPVWAACLVVALFALCHGYAHGIELPSAADPIGYSLGFVFATGSLHVIGIAVGALAWLARGELVLRGLGGLVSLVGLYFLWEALS